MFSKIQYSNTIKATEFLVSKSQKKIKFKLFYIEIHYYLNKTPLKCDTHTIHLPRQAVLHLVPHMVFHQAVAALQPISCH